MVLILFFILLLSGNSFAVYYCSDTGLYYSDRLFCDNVCSNPCDALQSNGSGLTCDTSSYELFVYNPQTNKTIAISKNLAFWDNYQNLLVIEDPSDNEAARQILSVLNTSAWIGLYDPNLSSSYNSVNPSRFIWYDGTPVSYTNWLPGEPNNEVYNSDIGNVSPLGEHWVEINPSGQWRDYGKHQNDPTPLRRGIVMWRNQLDCVNGIPPNTTTTNQDIADIYCDGNLPCYVCADTQNMEACEQSSQGWLCPLGKTLCITSGPCPQGTVLVGNRCEADPVINCPAGGTYNTQTGFCEQGYYICPRGGGLWNNNNNKCCFSSSYTYDGSLDRCISTPQPICPQGTTYHQQTGKCIANVAYSCPLGNYQCQLASDGNFYCSSNQCVDSQTITIDNDDNQTGLNDIPADGQVTSQGCMGTIYVFNGRDMRCRPPGTQTLFKDCCLKNLRILPGDLIDNCSEMEKMLADMRVWGQLDGNCHYVGEYCAEKWNVLGVIFCAQRKRTYCCFNSPLGRIVHQQGRPQLGIGWGTPESPNCRGFTIQEFQKLDFSRIDFSEWVEEEVEGNIAPKIESSLSNVIQNMKNNLQSQ